MQLYELTWSTVDGLSRDMPVVLPIAALEQHGRHMPVFTDSLLLGEIVRRAEEQMRGQVLFAPLLWLGNSEHHLDFPGTMTASPRVYLNVLADMVENFLTNGFRRIVLLNGHGGNTVPSQQAVFEIRQRHRQRSDLLLLAATYWGLGGRPEKVNAEFVQNRMGHACEWETSMMLKIRPDLVGPLANVEPVPFGVPFDPAYRGWITKDRSAPGHIGDPRQATAAKGETLLAVFTADVLSLLKRMLNWDGKSWDG
jgi:creatinine amidohydrolase